MGWYTWGPGGLEYKHGDVIGAARASGLGTLAVVPRVAADDYDDLGFLGPLQAVVEKAGLPWRHIEFAIDGDLPGLSMRVCDDVDPMGALEYLAALVSTYAGSIREVFGRQFSSLTVSIEVTWTIERADLPALVEWLNAPLGDERPISITELSEGGLDKCWYQPPGALTETLDRFAGDDPARHLAAFALAGAALTGEDFRLSQPDDEHKVLAWEDDGLSGVTARAGAVLFRPADHPFLALLAEAFDVSAALRESVFYAHTLCAVELPPEPDVPEKDLRAGLSYVRYTAGVLAALVAGRSSVPEDGGVPLTVGWHAGATLGELSRVFADAGLRIFSLDDLLWDHRMAWQSVADLWRDVVWKERVDSLKAGGLHDFTADYILNGRGAPPIPSLAEVAVLFVLLQQLDIPEDQRDRLERILRCSARDAAWI